MFLSKKITPRGPSLKKLRLTKKDLSNTVLSFKAPEPTKDINFATEPKPDSFDIYQKELYKAPFIKNTIYKGDLKKLMVFVSTWLFKCFDLFDPYSGYVLMSISVNSMDVLLPNESLFDNAILAREVTRDLYFNEFSRQITGFSENPYDLTKHNQPVYLAPINWQWVSMRDQDWLYFEVQPLSVQAEHVCWFTPISHKHFLCIDFTISKTARNAGNAYRRAQKVSSKPYIEFISAIMDSLELKLSPEALKQKAEIQRKNPNMSRPMVELKKEQIRKAAHTMYLDSGIGYHGKEAGDKESPEKVVHFIKERVKHRPIAGAYLGENDRLIKMGIPQPNLLRENHK